MDKNDIKNIRFSLSDILNKINKSETKDSLPDQFSHLSRDEIIQSLNKIIDLLNSYSDLKQNQDSNKPSGDFSHSLRLYLDKQESDWTKSEEQELINLHQSGADISEIAHILMRSKKSIRAQLKKLTQPD